MNKRLFINLSQKIWFHELSEKESIHCDPVYPVCISLEVSGVICANCAN